jgi:hypothetical protein
MDEKQRSIHTEFVCIEKERGVIAIYDISDFLDDRYSGEFYDPAKRFDMSIKNFAQVVMQWDALQEHKPDIVIIIVHEDKHVSLETDPEIIEMYEKAGYEFKLNPHIMV